jgi:hypothetical protein
MSSEVSQKLACELRTAHPQERLDGAEKEAATLRAALAGVAEELTALQAAAAATRDADAAQLAAAARQVR